MTAPKKIMYHNLREAAVSGQLPSLIGRREEIDRLTRCVGRRTSNNVFIVGPSGIGKTALAYGWMQYLSDRRQYDSYALVQLDTGHVYELEDDAALERYYSAALEQLPRSVVFIDDFGRMVYRNTSLIQRVHRLYKHLVTQPDVHLILTLEPKEYAWLERDYPAFMHSFETIILKKQTPREYERILARKLPRINTRNRIIVPDSSLEEVVSFAERFPSLGQLPRSAINLLDECISFSTLRQEKLLTTKSIALVVAAKTGIPQVQLTQGELQSVKNLESALNGRVVHQQRSIAQIANTLQRAKLGLRNPNRPLGSFLLLGPSGVGKTETAKSVAEILFGRPESFIRIDMSEFQQEHAVQRLIGAPPGYVGHEDGGALTNALRREPHSLILLDEIEKAHPKVFDIFLQVLDEGRLTSGQSETVDARSAIIMATSNAAVAEILEAHANGEDVEDEAFIREKALPILAKTFRLEFINRFDNILLFKPLTVSALIEVARLEVRKIERRFEKHNVRFEIEPAVIEARIRAMADPRFGARPIKRFIEETCESLLVRSLLDVTS